MGDIKVDLDISALTQYIKAMAKDIESDLQLAVKKLANEAHAHIVKDAENKLHSFRKQYLDNLSIPEKIDDNTWCITLKADASWIEEGIPQPYDMKQGLLKDGKISKTGVRYRVVPMNQGKTPGELSGNPQKNSYQQAMVDTIKAELRRKKIPYRQLEVQAATGRKTGKVIGDKPIMGKLHSLDIKSNIPGKGNTEQLHGINIYQKYNDKTNKVERAITTFRTVTDSEEQSDKWIHPSVEARGFFEAAKKWAEDDWVNNTIPALLQKYKG